ncbi:hypothetical protein Q9L42_003060 [Methylomarinum sp. Ch1-1]|uniref:Nucleotidyltransferase n=1 Tax=Methylomarinum roseum TaxID=3067653 RepID=A0AAU7NVX2_9GAMM|nr:hypothetical protein [Methylomarinum sp. Ch1-1]MDP4522838.1 hypothetical protein [Methylomarinum sp. Ch1-1]
MDDGLYNYTYYQSLIDIWLDMRDIRNKIAHDYVPEKMAEMYQLIRGEFYSELNLLNQKIAQIVLE